MTELGAEAGAVISSSHNPVQDNGIKFFGPDGYKLNDAEEDRIEALLGEEAERPTGAAIGKTILLPRPLEMYVDHALKSLQGRRLDGLTVVVDCAFGAAFETTPSALERAGAQVIAINAEPDGTRINVECGSTAPEVVAKRVVEYGADVGLAHDGDADRVIAIDENGNVIDGDAIIAILTLELLEKGRLANNKVVTTVMANLGFRRLMAESSVEVIETSVGDRYVIEAMIQHGAVIGGEQSGHVIFSEHATTGDGLITALRLLARMTSSVKRLSELASVIERFPQLILNVAVSDKNGFESSEAIKDSIESAERKLEGQGRILVRPSGTESVVRVMVEAMDEALATEVGEEVARTIEKELGA
ncbi:MAG: phosphoglucosamine mutase [Actinobacteria bacterium]|nr:phosphoglucosamine mutase [Actinomycetota bacterium]